MTISKEETSFRELCLSHIETQGISRAEFARRTGVSESVMHKYLSYARRISFKNKDLVSEYLEGIKNGSK